MSDDRKGAWFSSWMSKARGDSKTSKRKVRLKWIHQSGFKKKSAADKQTGAEGKPDQAQPGVLSKRRPTGLSIKSKLKIRSNMEIFDEFLPSFNINQTKERQWNAMTNDQIVHALKRQGTKMQRIRRFLLWFFMYLLGPSTGSRQCQQELRSRRSIHKEQARQIAENQFVIHPFSRFRLFWNILMTIIIMLTLFAVPIDLAFYSHPSRPVEEDQIIRALRNEYPGWYGYIIFTDISLMVDILLTFRTGYVTRNTRENLDDFHHEEYCRGAGLRKTNDVMRKILDHTWFVLDVIVALPFDEIYEASPSQARYVTIVQITRYLKFIVILRSLRFFRSIDDIVQYFPTTPNNVRLLKLVVITFIFLHWNACVQFTLCYATWYPHYPPDVWVAIDGLNRPGTPVFQKYTRSIFRAVSQMFTIGYGVEAPTHIGETAVVTASMLMGFIFHMLWVGTLVDIVSSFDSSGAAYDEVVSEMNEFLLFKHVPKELQHKVMIYFEQRYRNHFFEDGKFLRSTLLPLSLREAIAEHNVKELLVRVGVFKKAPADFIADLATQIRLQVYFRSDVISYAGRRNSFVFFIASGRVKFRHPVTNETLDVLVEGDYFGAMSMMFGELETVDVIAVDQCDIYTLSRENFNHIVEDYPQFKQDVLSRAYSERMEHLII